MTVEIQRAEILDWWEAERWRIRQEVLATQQNCLDRATRSIEGLNIKELLMPRSSARKDIERRLESDVNSLNRRLANSLKDSFSASVESVEGLTVYESVTLTEKAALVAGGTLAIGSLGIAGAATGVATTTGTFLFVIPTLTFSWPIFAVAGVSALGLAIASPKALQQGRRLAIERYLRNIQKILLRLLVEDAAASKKPSTWTIFQTEIDRVVQERLEKLI